MKIGNAFLVILTFILSGCASHMVPQEKINSVLDNQTALVICSSKISALKSSNKGILDSDYHVSHTVWKNNNNKDFFPSKDLGVYSQALWDDVLVYSIVNPGKYNLAYIIFSRFQPHLIGKDEYITETIAIDHLAEFSIKGGEVLYLGDITFNYNEESINYKSQDKLDQFRKNVETTIPTLLFRLEKRILSNPELSIPQIINVEREVEKI